jgi:hypothetical protein
LVLQNKFTFVRLQLMIDMRYTVLFISLLFLSPSMLCVGQDVVYKDSIVTKVNRLIEQSNNAQGNPELRYVYADSALGIAKNLGDEALIAKAQLSFGQACYSTGKYSEGISIGKKDAGVFYFKKRYCKSGSCLQPYWSLLS